MAARQVSISFLGNTRDLEAALERAGISAEVAGKKIGDKFNEGTNRAATGLGKLSSLGASWGIPFSESLDKIGQKLEQAETKTARFSTALQEAGKVTLAAGAVGFAGAAVEAVKMGEKFQQATTSIQNSAGITQKAAENIGNAFLNTAGHSTFSGQQMASAFAAVAGQLRLTEGQALSTAQATQFMKSATDLAEASQSDLGSTTAALAAVMQTYHMRVSDAAGASNILYNTSKSINVPIDQVATAVDKLHGRLGQLAPSLKDTSTLMVELSQHGITGSRGVMQANSALQTMLGNTPKVDNVLKALHVTLFDTHGQFVGLQNVIQQMQPKLAGLTQQQQLYVAQTVFGKSAGQAMLAIIQAGVPAYQASASAVQKHNAVSQAADAQAKTLHGEMETLKATVEDLGTKFGLFLIPKLQDAAKWLASAIQWMEKHKSVAIALGAAIAGPLAAAIGTFAVTTMGGMVASLGRGAQAILGLVARIATVGPAAATMEGEVAAADAGVVASADATAAGVDTALGSTGIGLVLVGLGVAATELATHWSQAMEAMKAAVQDMARGAETILNGLIDAFNATIGQLTGQIGKIQGWGGSFNGNYSTLPNVQRGSQLGQGLLGTNNAGIGYYPSGAVGGSQQHVVAAMAKKYGVPDNILWGVYGVETSHGSNIATSSAGAMGAFQFTAPNKPGTPFAYPMTNTPNAGQFATQAEDAAAYLAYLYHTHGNSWDAALHAYSGGGYGLASVLGQSGGAGGGSATIPAAGSGSAAIQGLINTAAKGKSGAAKAIKTLLYANPLPGLTGVGRTDQGVDFSATPGSAVNAIGAGRIVDIIANWYKGQPLVEEQLASGPNKGQYVYYAEQLQSLVHMGQQVAAGQRIGTVAPSGTGLELGFGAAGGRTLAQATTGYTEGQVTPAGNAFRKFFGSLGSGVYTTTSGGITTGGGANYGATASQLIQAFISQLQTTADNLVTKLGNVIQSGTVKTLTALLGVSTGGISGALNKAIEALPANASMHQIDVALGKLTSPVSAKSPRGLAMGNLVAELKASGLTGLAKELKAQWGAALATLSQELYAQQVLKDGESLQLQATQLKDQTQLQANADAATLAVLKAQAQKQSDALNAQTTAIKDMTQIATDRFAMMAQSIQDATQAMTDSLQGVAQGIGDQVQIQVDLLGERGLYGLNLVAQKLQVQADITKAYWDHQIALAQQNLDIVTTQAHANIAQAQLAVDQVQLQQDGFVAQSQIHMDTVTVNEQMKIAAAQAHMDSVQLHYDTAVVGPAQTAVDLNATAPKAQQDVFAAVLRRAQGQAGLAEGQAAQQYQSVYDAAQFAINTAQSGLAETQGKANEAITKAQQTLAQITGSANEAIANAQQTLAGTQGQAGVAEAQATGAVSVTQAQASTQFAGSGLVVNMYGIPVENATAVTGALDWFARNTLALSS